MDGGLWHYIGDREQDHPQEQEMQKAKWLSEEALQIAVKSILFMIIVGFFRIRFSDFVDDEAAFAWRLQG